MIKKHPAYLFSNKAKQILKELSALPDVCVSVVTGRSIENIKKLISVKNIAFAANHGFQIIHHDGSDWVHRNAISALPKIQELRQLLHRGIKSYAGSFVEDKHFTLSIHYRNVAPLKVSSLKSVVLELARPYASFLQITHGKKVIEVMPYYPWGKNNAVLELLKASQQSNRQLSIFIGDDTTDESVFQTLKISGITISVGKSTNTAVKYYVKNVNEVLQFLKLIVFIRTQRF